MAVSDVGGEFGSRAEAGLLALRAEPEPEITVSPFERPPERPPKGPWRWAKDNLFSSVFNTILTVVTAVVVVAVLRGLTAFIFAPERQWRSVGVNLRLYMTQAYPQEQYVRVWVVFGIMVALGGLSFAFWRAGGPMPVRRITGFVMGMAGFGALVVLVGPFVAVPTKLVWLAVAGAFFAAAAVVHSSEWSRRTEVSSMRVWFTVLVLLILAVWLVPFGHHSFVDGAVQPSEPGTVAMSTKVPLTVMAVVLVAAYWVGVALRDRVPANAVKGTLALAWLLSVPFNLFVILRDPDWDYGRVLSVWLPLFALFAIGGGVLCWFATNPSHAEGGRLLGGLILVAGGLSYLLTYLGLLPGMLQVVRLSILLLGVFVLGGPTFGGAARARRRYVAAWMLFIGLLYYFVAAINSPSTVRVNTELFLGGLSITILVAASTMIISFPIGVLLALGRTSKMPIFRVMCTTYIEIVRGVPLITILFFFSVMLDLFLPRGMSIAEIMAVTLGYSLFSAAYLAENVRGGLQAVRRGQYEASEALGMTAVQTSAFIVLPQALRAVIPALVGQMIAVFKETSLLAIVGVFDFLFIANKVVGTQSEFLGARRENLLFVSFVYWIFTFSMSRASLRLEKKLGVGER